MQSLSNVQTSLLLPDNPWVSEGRRKHLTWVVISNVIRWQGKRTSFPEMHWWSGFSRQTIQPDDAAHSRTPNSLFSFPRDSFRIPGKVMQVVVTPVFTFARQHHPVARYSPCYGEQLFSPDQLSSVHASSLLFSSAPTKMLGPAPFLWLHSPLLNPAILTLQ